MMQIVRNLLVEYRQHWHELNRTARLFLAHIALLTISLAIIGLFFNLAVISLGYSRGFLGLLNTIVAGSAAALSLPAWWLASRFRLRRVLLISALLNAASAWLFALWPSAGLLVASAILAGLASVLFQVSAAPFMMRHSDSATRDHLFSASAGVSMGLAGVGSLLAGGLPALLAGYLGVQAESGLAYRAAFGVAAFGVLFSIAPLLLISDPPAVSHIQQQREPAPVPDSPESGRMGKLLKGIAIPPFLWQNRGFIARVLLPPFLISCGAALLIPYLNLFFKERFAISDYTLGLIFALSDAATGVAALTGPLIAARYGKLRTVVFTRALALPFLFVIGFVPLLGLAVMAALVRVVLFNMAAPLYDAWALERTDESARPAMIGLIGGAYSAAYVFAPTISGIVQETYGFAPLFVATGICYTLAVILCYLFFVRTPA